MKKYRRSTKNTVRWGWVSLEIYYPHEIMLTKTILEGDPPRETFFMSCKGFTSIAKGYLKRLGYTITK